MSDDLISGAGQPRVGLLIATHLGVGRDTLMGVARYVRDAEDPDAAEIAVTIVDDWQGRGLGTELLARLSGRARAEGICRFTALVADDSVAMAGLLRKMSASLVGRSPGTVEYEITLMPPGKSTTTPAAGLRQDRVRMPC